MFALFTTFIYQPFFNILVFFYWIVDTVTGGQGDMGIAVVFLTILIRLLMLPLSFAGMRSESERREISRQINEVEEKYKSEPVKYQQEKKKIFKTNSKIFVAEIVNLFIQVGIALMLWRIFATGLSGEDIHLLYPFMPTISTNFNLVFLGRFDLTHPSLLLNIIQSILLGVLETLMAYTSPYPTTRAQIVRLQLVLPIVSFIVFLGLPAGKKLFVIVTLLFSIFLTLGMAIQKRFNDYKEKVAEREKAATEDPQVVVEVK
jgi:YidC/Oxa1 family membrane protein insertase